MSFTAPNQFSNLNKKHFNKIALIDADQLKHLVAYNIYTYLGQNYPRAEIQINDLIDDRLNSIFNQFTCKAFVFIFSGPSSATFRNSVSICKKYKGNRQDSTYYEGKIEDMAYVVKYIQSQYPTLIYPTLEADDILSMLQCEETFILSNDKDLKQVPGFHFDIYKQDLIEIKPEEALRTLAIQLLTGDSTDNIPGLPGYGAVKAEKVLKDVKIKSCIQAVQHEYNKVYGITAGTDAFVESWNLIKLRLNRGDHFREKYKEAFELLEILKKQ